MAGLIDKLRRKLKTDYLVFEFTQQLCSINGVFLRWSALLTISKIKSLNESRWSSGLCWSEIAFIAVCYKKSQLHNFKFFHTGSGTSIVHQLKLFHPIYVWLTGSININCFYKYYIVVWAGRLKIMALGSILQYYLYTKQLVRPHKF